MREQYRDKGLRQGFYAWRDGVWVPTLAPRVEISRGRIITTLERLLYVDRSGERHTVEVGFRCDGGTKPKIIWPLFGHPFGRYLLAYIFHDKGYALMRLVEDGGACRSLVRQLRRDADRLFREMQAFIKQNSGFGRIRSFVEKAKIWKKYRAVRMFGGMTRGHQKNTTETEECYV